MVGTNLEEQTIDLRGLKKLIKIIDELRKLDPELPSQTIVVLLEVMISQRVTQKDLLDAVKMNSASLSRNVAALSGVKSFGKSGAGVVKSFEDPQDRRCKIVELNHKGEALRAKILHLLLS